MALSHLKTKAKYKKMVARNSREDSITRLLLIVAFEQKSEIEKELILVEWFECYLILFLEEFMSTKIIKSKAHCVIER